MSRKTLKIRQICLEKPEGNPNRFVLTAFEALYDEDGSGR